MANKILVPKKLQKTTLERRVALLSKVLGGCLLQSTTAGDQRVATENLKFTKVVNPWFPCGTLHLYYMLMVRCPSNHYSLLVWCCSLIWQMAELIRCGEWISFSSALPTRLKVSTFVRFYCLHVASLDVTESLLSAGEWCHWHHRGRWARARSSQSSCRHVSQGLMAGPYTNV